MRLEIERKFLVRDSSWRDGVLVAQRLRDGLVAVTDRGKVRVRIVDGHTGWVTLKGARDGIGRLEFEYPIPVADAERLLETLCGRDIIEKTRHLVPHAGLTWQVDEHHGALDGIVFAEVELEAASQAVPLPAWVGEEVTGDPRWQQRRLLRQANAAVVQSA